LYSPRTSLVLPRTSSCFLVLPRTSWYSLVLPRTPSYSLRTSFVLWEYGSLAFPPVIQVHVTFSHAFLSFGHVNFCSEASFSC
jgi:hypothetical protein